MLDDPLRAQSLSLIAGCVLAAIAVAACAILAYLQPRGTLGSAPIVMVRESGALYVRIGDIWHPVLNLASARLIAGSPSEPELVRATAIEGAKRGPLVGVPGAPDTTTPADDDSSEWTVCDDAAGATTVLAGEPVGQLDAGRNALVSVRGGSAATTYLLYDGRRAKVDLRNHAVVRALRLDGVAPRPVSGALLDALPEAPEIAAPVVPKAGAVSMLRGAPVGTVVRMSRAGSVEYYVVLAHGVQKIGEVAADLISFTRSGEIITAAPDAIATMPVVNDLPVATFPDRGGVADDPMLCARWSWSQSSGAVNATVLVGDSPLLRSGHPLTLVQADDAGPRVDNVHLAAGRIAYVRATGVSGEGQATGPLYLVSEAGVVFGLQDEDAARRLGLPDTALPAPWPLLARLPRGPELSVGSASIVRDSVDAPS
jgi:type VII secretion protein EccB